MKLVKLFDYEILQKEDIEMPDAAAGDILISPTSGGRFTGGRLTGEILPTGFGLCYTHGPEGAWNDIKATSLLRTEDGCDILMHLQAYYDVAPDIEERLMRGETVDPDSYYYKGWVSFETGAAKYKWLERRLCVCECVIEDYTRLSIAVYMAQ